MIEPTECRIGANRQKLSVWPHCLHNPSLLALLGELRPVMRECETVLDVGCGDSSPLRFLSGPKMVGVDGYAPAVDKALRNGTHDEVVLGDVKQIGGIFKDRRFDACIALDVIEHLPKSEGWKMLESMERLATRFVIIFTPNGFVPQRSKDGDLQEHLSGWEASEMRDRGYCVLGMYGPKMLRGEYHRVKYQPKPLFVLASLFCHYTYTRTHAEKAAAIFCIKRISR